MKTFQMLRWTTKIVRIVSTSIVSNVTLTTLAGVETSKYRWVFTKATQGPPISTGKYIAPQNFFLLRFTKHFAKNLKFFHV
jgi:hypothetical protein